MDVVISGNFYVNSSPVSISGTTSAAVGQCYQVESSIFSSDHVARDPVIFNTTASVGGIYHEHSDRRSIVYDSNLNDLIDARPFPIRYSNSKISTDLSENRTVGNISDSGIWISGNSYPQQYPLTSMAPTAISSADSSASLMDFHLNCSDRLENAPRSIICQKMKKSRNPHLAQQQRRQANMRERRRMKSINHAFDGLRQKIPTLPYEKKLSKVDTLKLAINYIQFLQELIETDEGHRSDNNEHDGSSPDVENVSKKRNQRSTYRINAPNSPPAKIIIECRTAMFSYDNDDTSDIPPVRGHSLSWTRIGETNSHSLTAKVWRPQNPQQPQSNEASLDVISFTKQERSDVSPVSSSAELCCETKNDTKTDVSPLDLPRKFDPLNPFVDKDPLT